MYNYLPLNLVRECASISIGGFSRLYVCIMHRHHHDDSHDRVQCMAQYLGVLQHVLLEGPRRSTEIHELDSERAKLSLDGLLRKLHVSQSQSHVGFCERALSPAVGSLRGVSRTRVVANEMRASGCCVASCLVSAMNGTMCPTKWKVDSMICGRFSLLLLLLDAATGVEDTSRGNSNDSRSSTSRSNTRLLGSGK